MTALRIAVPCGVAIALALAAFAVGPQAFEAVSLLAAQDDPVAIADHAVARSFDATVAAREIDAALAANDADLAQGFLDLGRERNLPLDPALAHRVERANEEAATTRRSLESFARGFVTGEPEDGAALAGTAVGDLFVFGDVRDAVRESVRFASGQQGDELILGLACVGVAVTAGTYATAGLGAPARAGLTLIKAARKTGAIGGRIAAAINRSLREAVDWNALERAAGKARIFTPVASVRAVREAVKVEKAEGLVRLVGDVGRVQSKAGTRAALDGLRIAESPGDMSRIAQLAAAKGGKTRAILKLAGRGAIMVTMATFDLAMWVLWGLLTAFGLVSSLKRTAERITERYCARRRRLRAALAAQ
jgi:hypothetical protein